NTTGVQNAALGYHAGQDAATGSYNVFLGANVTGTSSDANTIRIGLPYSGGTGQNRTFIAGIRGTQLTGSAVPVYIDANGQLGTLTPPIQSAALSIPVSTSAQQVRSQSQPMAASTVPPDLSARLARLEQQLLDEQTVNAD